MIKRKVDNIPLAAGKSKMFSIGCLNILDIFNFLAMPLDQMAKICVCKNKTLYSYEHFGLDDYDNFLGNLNIEDFKSSLSYKLPTKEEVDIFNKDNSHKTDKDLTVEYLQNDVEILDYCNNEYVKLGMKKFSLKICDINYTNSCKDRTEQLALMPNKRQMNDNELGYREIETGRARTEKLFLDQNKTEYMGK